MSRKLILPILILIILIEASACSSHLGYNSDRLKKVQYITLNGTLELPAGFLSKYEKLHVETSTGTYKISSNGTFSIKQSGNSEALAFVTDDSGNPLLMGFLSASGDNPNNSINAKSTATALLFQALPAYTLPRSNWPQVIDMINNHPATETLANAITQSLMQTTNALGNKDQFLLDSLEEAVNCIRINITASNQTTINAQNYYTEKPQSKMKFLMTSTAAIDVTVESSGVTLVSIDPSAEQSGIRVAPNDNGNGIIITNAYRRHLWAFVYRVGWKGKDDDTNTPPHPIEPWEAVLPQGSISGYIQAVNGFQGTLGTLLDATQGRAAYSPVSCEPILLSLEPQSAERTYYKVIVVGASWKSGSFSDDLPADMKTRPEVRQWLAAQQKMDLLSLFHEFLLPAVLTVFPTEALGQSLNSEVKGKFAEEAVKLISNSYPQFIEQIHTHDYQEAMLTFFKSFDNQILREQLIEMMIRAGLLKGGITMSAAALVAEINIYVSMIDKFLSAGDLGIVSSQLLSSSRMAIWSGTAVKPNVRIQNDPSVVTAGLDVTLTCYGVAGIDGVKEYEWLTSNKYGHLEDSHGNSGTHFTSSDQNVRYIANNDAKDGSIDTVGVIVRIKESGKKKEIGRATAKVAITDTKRDLLLSPSAPSVKPHEKLRLDASILPSVPEDAKVKIEWSCTRKYGTLMDFDGNESDGVVEGDHIVYKAGPNPGTDSITATAWRLTSDDKWIPICTTTTSVSIGSCRIVLYMKEPYLDNNIWYYSVTLYLILQKEEGAYQYFATLHADGANPPLEWATGLQDGKRMEILPETNPDYLLGIPENPDSGLKSNEMYYYLYGIRVSSNVKLSEEEISAQFESQKDIVAFFRNWTAEIEARK